MKLLKSRALTVLLIAMLVLTLGLGLMFMKPTSKAFAAEVGDEEALKAAVAEDGEVELTANVELTETLVVTGNVTLNLGEFTLSNGNGYTISVSEDATLTLTGNGIVEQTKGRPAIYINAGATAVIESGTYQVSGGNHYTLENYGTTTIKGGTFTHIDAELTGTISLIANKVGGKMEISGGDFSGMIAAVKNESSVENALLISGGTFNALDGGSNNIGQAVQNQGVATITGGTFNAMVANLSQLGSSGETEFVGSLTIDGGTFNERVRSQKVADDDGNLPQGTPLIEIQNGIFNANIESDTGSSVEIKGGKYHASFVGIGKIEISGGTFDKLPPSTRLVDGFSVYVDEDGHYGVRDSAEVADAVLYVNSANSTKPTQGFPTLASCMEYAKDYAETNNKKTMSITIRLLENLTESLVIPNGFSVYLQLNNCALTNTPNQHTITVQNGGSLVTSDVNTYNGTVKNLSSGCAALYVEEGGSATVRRYTLTRDGEVGGNYFVIENYGTCNIYGLTSVSHENAEAGINSLVINRKSGVAAISDNGTASKMPVLSGMPIAVENEEGATLTIANSSLQGDIVSRGAMTINGGTYGEYDILAEEGSSITIGGGTFNGELILNSDETTIFTPYSTSGIFSAAPTFMKSLTINSVKTAIKGGVFNDVVAVKGELKVSYNMVEGITTTSGMLKNGDISTPEFNSELILEGTTTISGGTFNGTVNARGVSNIFNGYNEIKENEIVPTFNCGLNIEGVATISGGIFMSDTAHVLVVKDGGELTVSGNTSVTASGASRVALLVEEGGMATVENGYFEKDVNDVYYTVQNWGTLVINGGEFHHYTGEGAKTMTLVDNWGDLTINGGNFYAHQIAIKSEELSTLTITNGYFECSDEVLGYVVEVYSEATISGGTFMGRICSAGFAQGGVDYVGHLEITGGKFHSGIYTVLYVSAPPVNEPEVEISGGEFGNLPAAKHFAEGYAPVWNEENNVWGVKEEQIIFAYGDYGFATLEEALEYADLADDSNPVISLYADYNGSIEVTRHFTLDLGGYSITANDDHAIIVKAGGDLTIIGEGTVKTTMNVKSALLVEKDGIAYVNGGNFTRESSANHYTVDNFGTLTLKDGNFTHEDAKTTGTVSLVNNRPGAELNIEGGKFSGMLIAIKNEENGATLTITGGEFEAGNQSVENWGVAKISGGTYTGMVISWASEKYGYEKPELTITGGIFKAKVTAYNYDAGETEDVSAANVAISGGTFYVVPSLKHFAEGFGPKLNNDGVTFGVTELTDDSYVVTVSGITADNMTYGDSISFNYDNLVFTNAMGGVLTDVALSVEVKGEFSTYDAGENVVILITSIILTGEDAGKYTLALTHQQTYVVVDIARAVLVVSVDAQGNPVYDGFVNGEDASVLGGTLELHRDGNTVTPSGLTSNNYDIVFVSATVSDASEAANDLTWLWVTLAVVAAVSVAGVVFFLGKRREQR